MRITNKSYKDYFDVKEIRKLDYLIEYIPDELLEKLLDLGDLRQISSQQCLIGFGEYCTESFLVLNGAFVCQYFEQDTAVERTINFHTESFHPFMTSFESYFNNTKSTCKLKAVCSSEVLVFKKSVINELIESDPGINRLCFAGLSFVLTSEIRLRSKLTTLTTDNLYIYILQNYPQIIKRIPSKYIAEFMGVSQEWLSKLKKKILIENS